MHPGQALLHYRKAVIAGSFLAPASLIVATSAEAVSLASGASSVWLSELSALGMLSFWIAFSLGVTFLPVGVFFVVTSRYGRRELAVHTAWIILCGVATPFFFAALDDLQAQSMAPVLEANDQGRSCHHSR